MGRVTTTVKSAPNPGISDTKTVYGTGQYRVYTSSCLWTVPPGVGSVRVSLLGGGGGGGGVWTVSMSACSNAGNAYLTSKGGYGGGGGYGVGTASVTPGCQCCIVVGAGGTSSAAYCYYWCTANTCGQFCCNCGNTGVLSAPGGSAGGYSCAFGLCASGGGGGCGGKCWVGALDPLTWTCGCCNQTLINAVARVCGGQGGTAYGTYITRCGGNGSCGGSGCANTNIMGYVGVGYTTCDMQLQPGYGGSSGSVLGDGRADGCVPTPFNNLAFDLSSDTDTSVQLKYDLPYARWPGQIIYTQAGCGVGTNVDKVTCSYSCSYTCCYTCSYSNCVGIKQYWKGSTSSDCCRYYAQCNAGGWTNLTTSFTPSYGGGGAPASLATYWGGCCCCTYMGASSWGLNPPNGGQGLVVVEW